MSLAHDFAIEILRKSERRALSRMQAWLQRKADLLIDQLEKDVLEIGESPLAIADTALLKDCFSKLAVNIRLINELEQIYRRVLPVPQPLAQSQAHILVDCWGRAQQVRALLLDMIKASTASPDRTWSRDSALALAAGAKMSLALVTGFLAQEGELTRAAKLSDWANSPGRHASATHEQQLQS